MEWLGVPLNNIRTLTLTGDRIGSLVYCDVIVKNPQSLGSISPTFEETCVGLWDTGASHSAIFSNTSNKLGLIANDYRIVSGLGGSISKPVYCIDLVLPNGLTIINLNVTEMDSPSVKNDIEFGILIGMDIICKGDFSITNFKGITKMTFRTPSLAHIDFTSEHQSRIKAMNKRNWQRRR